MQNNMTGKKRNGMAVVQHSLTVLINAASTNRHFADCASTFPEMKINQELLHGKVIERLYGAKRKK